MLNNGMKDEDKIFISKVILRNLEKSLIKSRYISILISLIEF